MPYSIKTIPYPVRQGATPEPPAKIGKAQRSCSGAAVAPRSGGAFLLRRSRSARRSLRAAVLSGRGFARGCRPPGPYVASPPGLARGSARPLRSGLAAPSRLAAAHPQVVAAGDQTGRACRRGLRAVRGPAPPAGPCPPPPSRLSAACAAVLVAPAPPCRSWGPAHIAAFPLGGSVCAALVVRWPGRGPAAPGGGLAAPGPLFFAAP